MLDTTEESTYFTKLKAGGRFVIYALSIYLVATFTAGCLGAVIGFPLLTFPLAMLISNPVVWVLMGIILTVAYKMVAEPLFHLAKGYINGKRASKEEKSKEAEIKPQELQKQPEENQERPKTPDRDSGVVPGSEPDSRNSSRRSSLDSGLGGKEFHENLDTLVHQTNGKHYGHLLTNSDIEHIARVVYGYLQSEHSDNNIYFLAPGYSNGMNKFTEKCLQDYRDKLKQNNILIFTSVFHINGNHWTALVIKPDAGDKKFRAYYCDSFGNQLPNNVLNIVKGELSKEEWSLDIASSKVKQQSDGHNCGIFALENAHRITQMLNEGKSFDEIDAELSEYKPNPEQLQKKRREFTKALMEDEKWKEDLENGLLCDLPPGTDTSLTSRVQNTAQVAI